MYNDITARSATLQAGMGVALALLVILDFVLNSIYLNVYNLDLIFGVTLAQLSYCAKSGCCHRLVIALTT
jgi:hypothetical protein